jgi:tRNA (cmo5U34)-methyltransferase
MTTGDVFDRYAAQYDLSRKKLIPCFDDFYQTATAIIPFSKEQPIKVLDLGSGTGLMAGLTASLYPDSEIDLVDIAGKMLDEARKNLKDFQNKFNFIVSDYSEDISFNRNYDLIISSLSIHHLSGKNKQKLFHKIFSHLKSGGIFINADQVLGETEEIDKIYRQTWIEQVKKRGTDENELAAAFERMKEDKMSSLSSQLQWLKDAGFSQVNCWFKSFSFVVYSGTRQKK